MDWKTLFFSPEGRIGRSAFWIGWLVLVGANVVLGWIPLVGWALSLATIYCSVCVFSKRLHDMGRSGFLQVWPMVVCMVLVLGAAGMAAGPAIMAGISNADEAAVAAALMAGLGGMLLALLAVLVVSVGFLLWVGVSNGDPGENRYGPAPLPPVAA